MEYIVVALICFVLGSIYASSGSSKLDTQIMSNLKLGKRVIICVDDDATMFEMNGDKIKITKAIVDFNPEPIELPLGAQNELESTNLDDLGHDQSGNYNEAGMGD